jgi:hypothetical protein
MSALAAARRNRRGHTHRADVYGKLGLRRRSELTSQENRTDQHPRLFTPDDPAAATKFERLSEDAVMSCGLSVAGQR